MYKVDPSYCEQKILDLHGEDGQAWLAQLPALVAACAQRWSLEVRQPFPIPSYSYVAPAIYKGTIPVVLKIGFPNQELSYQVDALRYWAGSGICRLIDADAVRGVLLLEQVLPGEPLSTITDDDQVTHIALEVMQRLWKSAPEQRIFPTVADWADDLQALRKRFNGGTGPFPNGQIEKAEGQFTELLREDEASFLIHGDMNWGNILRSQREAWLAIDPKGVIGNPLYDVATFLNDPPHGLSEAELRSLLARRISLIAEKLQVEKERVKAWGQAHCILAGYWTYEDQPGVGWKSGFRQAEIYDQV